MMPKRHSLKAKSSAQPPWRRAPILGGREKKILLFLRERQKSGQTPPTIREIGTAVDISSTGTIAAAILSLEEHGYILRERGSARSIRLCRQDMSPIREGVISVPILPLPAEPGNFWSGTPEDTLTLDRRLFQKRRLAAVRVPESYRLMGILTGKFHLVLVNTLPRSGDSCAALFSDSLVGGPLYRTNLGWRLFDLFTRDEILVSSTEMVRCYLGRIVTLISVL